MHHPSAPTVRPADLARLALLPLGVTFGAVALLWMAGFGQTPPDHLPLATLVFFGALFADAAAQALRRSAARGGIVLAAGVLAAVPVAARIGTPADLSAVGTTVLGAALLLAFPTRRAEMVGAMSVYVAATLLANYTLDAFLPLGDWFLINVGTLFFGVTFTQRDRVHRFGRPAVYTMIAVAALANVAAALSLATPLRFVAVSFFTILASEAADTEIFQRLARRRWLTRVLGSNAVSAPLDTVLFTVLAFAGMPFATATWMLQVITTDVAVKYGSGLVTALLLLRARGGAPPAPPEDEGGTPPPTPRAFTPEGA
ncbi:MAG: VUT family protein [Trueperaceae bacterium]|nr:VUT family protein [Trueperaceae bacterium]